MPDDPDDLPPEQDARHKAKHSGKMFYVIGKDKDAGEQVVIPAEDFGGWLKYSKYYRIDFIAFPRRRR